MGWSQGSEGVDGSWRVKNGIANVLQPFFLLLLLFSGLQRCSKRLRWSWRESWRTSWHASWASSRRRWDETQKHKHQNYANWFRARTFDWSVLRTLGRHLWATFLMFFSGIPHLPTSSAMCHICHVTCVTCVTCVKSVMYVTCLALFDISISNINCWYIDTFEKYWYRYGHFENIDIDMVILKISISISISIRQFWKISISKSISIRQFWKYRYRYRYR